MKKTKKAFREYLNETCKDIKHKHYRYGQRSRGYGDYLYNQDRVMFDVNYNEWLKEGE